MILNWAAGLLLMLAATPAYAVFCAKWDPAKSVGRLSPKEVREASGMAHSTQFAGRMYWVNDSGDKGQFYFSDENGKKLQKVPVAGLKPQDMEALSLTDCPEGRCLVIGDIGDNNRKRKALQLTFVLETAKFENETAPLRTLTLEYPDGPHDAEAMAFLPDGTLWIVTKEIYIARFEARPARVYTLPKPKWSAGGRQTLAFAGELPFPKWLSEDLFFMQAPTDMAVNVQRQVAGFLTYGRVVEIPLKSLSDLARAGQWQRGQDFEIVNVKALAQQESMAYSSSPDRILWSTEYRAPEAPIFSMTCVQPRP